MVLEPLLLLTHPAQNVLQITLNRPRNLNAISRQLIEELLLAIADFEQSSDHVLILTGAGRAFCFGADFREFEDRSALQGMLQNFQNLIERMHYCSKVTIAVLNGFATGAGLDIALACDLRIAAEKIKIGEAYLSMGLVPDGGGSYLLTKLIGLSRASEMFLTGEAITAERAYNIGLIHQIHPAADLQSRAVEFAAAVAQKPQTALRLTKKLLRINSSGELRDALQEEQQAQQICFEDPSHRSIVEDFLKKRKKES